MALTLALAIQSRAEAIAFKFDWTGQIAGFRVSVMFGYDETQSYTDGIVRTDDLDFLHISFFAPDGTLLRTYEDNHLDPGVNFNFDTVAREVLWTGNYNGPEGINLGSPNYDNEIQMGNDPINNDDVEDFSLSFWSKPPRSNTPHLHIDDWKDNFGFPIGFSYHEDVAFPTKTTQDRIDTGKVGDAYLPPNGQPVTPLNETGQYPQVRVVPESAKTLDIY